jgi:hypothetical protein
MQLCTIVYYSVHVFIFRISFAVRIHTVQNESIIFNYLTQKFNLILKDYRIFSDFSIHFKSCKNVSKKVLNVNEEKFFISHFIVCTSPRSLRTFL